MKNWKQKVIILFFVLFALLALPFFIPTQSYITQVQQLVADKLKAPVVIGDIKVAFLPTPRLNLHDVRLGQHDAFVAKGISIIPQLTSLFSETKVISSVVVDAPVVKKNAMELLSGLSSDAPQSGKAAVSVRQVEINALTLVWGELPIPVLNMDVHLAADNAFESASIRSENGQLQLDAVQKTEAIQLTLQADDWKLPVAYPFLFNHLKANAVVRGNHVDVNALDAQLYHGSLHYAGALSWDKHWVLNGKFNMQGISLREPLALFSNQAKLSGALSGEGHLNATAKSAAGLADALKLHIGFNVDHGVLYGFDLASAATSMLTREKQGGETQFDELSGMLDMLGKQYQLTQLKVSSGVLSANGAVTISPTKSLDGLVNVALKNSLALTEIPLSVSGNLDSPVVLPTKAAMAGAAVGTAILGPGVGTSVGIKASGAVDKIKGLFGGGK